MSHGRAATDGWECGNAPTGEHRFGVGRLASRNIGTMWLRRKAAEPLKRSPHLSGRREKRDNREPDGWKGLDCGSEGKEWYCGVDYDYNRPRTEQY